MDTNAGRRADEDRQAGVSILERHFLGAAIGLCCILPRHEHPLRHASGPVQDHRTTSSDGQADLSPDDALLAYASEQSGRWEIYVQALGGTRGTWQISSEGGQSPRWRADGRELFFLSRPDRVMSVEVIPGPAPRFSAPRELFRQPIESFDMTPDGQRLVGLRPADADVTKPLTLVTRWTELLRD